MFNSDHWNPKKWNVKKILKEIGVTLLILLILSNIISYLRKPNLESDSLPSFKTETILKKKIESKSYKGKPVLLHIWATWCPTCRLENANIERVSKKYNVITIALKSGSIKELQTYMSENNFTFDVINDSDGSLSQQFHVEVFPTTFIYDSNSQLKFSEVGYSTTVGLLARMAMIK